jgi:protein SCO1/2
MAVVLAAVLSLGALVLVATADRGEQAAADPLTSATGFAGSLLPEGVRAPDFELRDQDGEPISMSDFRGQPAVVTFLYTTCEETCPIQAQQIKGALDELGHDVPAIAIAVEPEVDSPERARAFLAEQRMTGQMDFVLGSEEQLRPLWDAYAIQPQLPDAEHQGRIVLVDGAGRQRVSFPVNQATPERIAHDLRRLESES